MKQIDWKQFAKHRGLGLVTMLLGVGVLFAPIVMGAWIIALLGIVFLGAGLLEFIHVLRSPDRFASFAPYITGAICVLIGCILFVSPTMALFGVLVILMLALWADGAVRVYSGFRLYGSERWWSLLNGAFTIFLGLLIILLFSANLGFAAIGIVLGLWLTFEGWTMMLMPERGTFTGEEGEDDPRIHPDFRLGLEPSDVIKEIQEPLLGNDEIETSYNAIFALKFIALFFVIHLLRTDAEWSFIGLISPFAAVIGDTVVALILGLTVLFPLRLLFRKLLRPVERAAWYRFIHLRDIGDDPTILERGLEYWLRFRMRFALELRQMRYSLNYAVWRLLRYGLPLTALFIAVNSIWGFSWYFNSENWASAVWQEIMKGRIDAWRQRAAEDVEREAVAGGILPEKVFAIEPGGTFEGDFSFIVIGDTGEGDPSQMVLRDQLIAAGKRDEVKFLVLSSDVIYPDGKMKDYERNFYLPFKGFEKPVYAIPGNHDWFDANEGFSANFLERTAAITTLRARLLADLKTELIQTDEKFNGMSDEAERLRKYYKVQNGLQRAPYFEMHSPGFSIIAGDTGILRSFDEKQKLWFEEALKRAGSNFKLVVLGHPFYVAGRYTASADAGFREIHELLKRYKVDVAMAGDTHDFEFYKERYASSEGEQEMLHFVNGGGGAYLSIGTSVAFPDDPDSPDFAFYPSTRDVNAKLDRETPFWKQPFLQWMRLFGGYPFDSEMVSGAFDFNSAPFFQSFLEVRVERSMQRVKFVLHGINGPLRWGYLRTGGTVRPASSGNDDPVEFIAPIVK